MWQRFKLPTIVGRVALFIVLSCFYYIARDWPFFSQSESFVPLSPAVPDSAATDPMNDLIVMNHTVMAGQTLAQILSSSYVHRADVFPAIEALRRIFDPRALKPGRALQMAVDSAGALHLLQYQPSPELTVRVRRNDEGEFVGSYDTLEVVTETYLLKGELKSTLYEAIRESEETPELMLAYTDIFQWDVDFFIDPRKGDRFKILFEKQYVAKENGELEFVRYGKILSATYEQADTSYAAFFMQRANGEGGYFDYRGQSFQKTFLKSPLNYRRISSHFSYGRKHPILKKVRAHTGVDFAAPRGTPVVATANGVIVELGWFGGYGNRVVVQHKNHFSTLYGHLSAYASGLKVGAEIKQNQVIGYVGSTGLATGSHLHYTMYLNGSPIDPLRMRPSAADPLKAEELTAFFEHRNSLLVALGEQRNHGGG